MDPPSSTVSAIIAERGGFLKKTKRRISGEGDFWQGSETIPNRIDH